MTYAYTPRKGTDAHKVLSAMKLGQTVSADDLAAATGVDKSGIKAALIAAISHGFIRVEPTRVGHRIWNNYTLVSELRLDSSRPSRASPELAKLVWPPVGAQDLTKPWHLQEVYA